MMGPTSSSTWKRAESALGAIFGAKRRPLSGSSNRDDIDGDDVMHPRLFLESKLRAKSAVWSLWRKTRDQARTCLRVYQGGHKTPVLGLREKYQRGLLLVIHSDDFREVVIEYLSARTDEETYEIECGVRVRRQGLWNAAADAGGGPVDRDRGRADSVEGDPHRTGSGHDRH